MAKLKEITGFLDNYLKKEDVEDESWNGLQVEGKENVNRVMFAVDTGMETFERAIKEKADMIIVHHGLFWKSSNPSLKGMIKSRIEILQSRQISLYAAHLPLDRHRTAGNNARLLRILGAEITEGAFFHKGKNIGWVGALKKPKHVKEIAKILDAKLNTKCTILGFGAPKIKRVAVCSGGGGYPDFFESMEKNADLYVTGASIDVYHNAKDSNMNVIFAGHHATETVGVKALSDIIKKKFNVTTIFIDIPTGL